MRSLKYLEVLGATHNRDCALDGLTRLQRTPVATVFFRHVLSTRTHRLTTRASPYRSAHPASPRLAASIYTFIVPAKCCCTYGWGPRERLAARV